MKDNFHVKFTWFISMLISVKFYWNSQHRICTSECNLFTRASVQSVFDCWFPCAFFENWISIDEAQPEAITLILPSSTKYFFPSSFSLFFFGFHSRRRCSAQGFSWLNDVLCHCSHLHSFVYIFNLVEMLKCEKPAAMKFPTHTSPVHSSIVIF